ncbi:hypothetical protein [Luteitalea sp.]
MSESTTEPLVPLLRASEEAMAVSNALRQAAIDAAHLPPGVHFAYERTSLAGQAAQSFGVTVKAADAYGQVLWSRTYDKRGRLYIGGGITF